MNGCGMKVYVECESLRHALKQTVGALNVSRAKLRLNLTADYSEAVLHVNVSLFTDDETIMPDVISYSDVAIVYVTNDDNFILSSEVLQVESVSVEVEDVISLFKWVTKRPKKYEYFAITVSESYICFEQCDMNRNYNGGLSMEVSAGYLKTPCVMCGIPAHISNVEYTDMTKGKKFLDTVETLYAVISDLPSIDSPARYLYFLNGTAKAYTDIFRVTYEGDTGLENEFILAAECADYVFQMGKECHTKFLKDSDVNDFCVRIGTINSDKQVIIFVGVNNALERIYGKMTFGKTTLADIEYHESVTDNDSGFARVKPHNVSIAKEMLMQSIKDAEALNVETVDFEANSGSVALKSLLGKTEVSASCSYVESELKFKFAIKVKLLKKLAKSQFDIITINFNADENVDRKQPVLASNDSNQFMALCQTT